MTIEKCDTKTLKFRVFGEAIPLGRVRAVSVGGRIRTYTPQKSVEEKAAVRAIVQQAMEEQHWKVPSQDMPIKVELVIKCECPKSRAFWIHTAAAKGLIVPLAGKGDVDNILKLYLDAMNKVVFPDDKQVFQATVTREYLSQNDLENGLGPYVEVKVTGFYLNYGNIKIKCALKRAPGGGRPPKKKKEGETNGNE